MFDRFFHINICVSDMDRAIAFYTALGFDVAEDVHVEGTDVAPHLGITVRELRAVILTCPGTSSPMIDLVQLIDPPAATGPYPRLDNLGAARISFWTDDVDRVLAHLAEHGIETFGPDVRYPSPTNEQLRTVVFRDPDGTALQVIGSGLEVAS
ncbi:VOC family protein [Streptomyces sp. NBC_00080]|uniref:VOC family protein n=1 Tax=Streptomyces sp. NBC_00080 TaxID=2975645 RepID=UPI00324966B9